MSREYRQFTKGQFEYELKGILIRNKAGFLKDITENWIEQGNKTWERIYSITTKNPAVNIIVFSSVDMTTNSVRDYGSDAVRVVLCWSTRKGSIYKAVHTHYRLNTLFQNLERTILSTKDNVFNLNFKEFTPFESTAQ